MTPQLVFVRPYGDATSQLDALNAVLKQLPGGGELVRDAALGDYAAPTDGYYRVLCTNPSFVIFAVKNQGYALDARLPLESEK